MHVAVIIAASLLGAGVLLYLHHRFFEKKDEDRQESPSEKEEICCGMHITCEKDSLSPVFIEDIEYFDDDELDLYKNRAANEYDDKEIEQFREVLLTLRPEEIGRWARSIQMRGIEMPQCVRDELLILVDEYRKSRL